MIKAVKICSERFPLQYKTMRTLISRPSKRIDLASRLTCMMHPARHLLINSLFTNSGCVMKDPVWYFKNILAFPVGSMISGNFSWTYTLSSIA